MADRPLRDANGRLLGKISTLSDGRAEIRDQNSRLLGRYDPRENKTRDRNSRIVGYGDLLSSLLDKKP